MKRLAALLLAVASVVSACGGEDARSPEATVAEAAATTRDAGSWRFVMAGEIHPYFRFRGSGVIDFRRDHGHFVLNFPREKLPDEKPGEIVIEFPPETVETITIGDTEYEKGFHPYERRRWIKTEREDIEQEGPNDVFEMVMPFPPGPHPSEVLTLLVETSDEVKPLGTEEVRNVETLHYRAAVDFEKLILQAPTEHRDRLREDLRADFNSAQIEDGLPVDVWIDREGLVRKLTLRFTATEAKGWWTIELFDFGVEVKVKPPPADEVVDDEEALLEGS